MKMHKLYSIALILSVAFAGFGCASNVKAPQTDNWSKISTAEVRAVKPLELPSFPQATLENDKIAYELEDAKVLDEFKVTARSNYAISLKLVEELEWGGKERQQLIKAGQLTEDRANFYAEQFAVAEEGRRGSEKWRVYERWGWQALLVILGLGL